MSAAAKGAQVERVLDEAQRELEPAGRTFDADDANAVSQPRRFTTGTEQWDREQALKQRIASDNKGNTPFGQLTFQDRDARALLKKQEARQQMAFDGWFGKSYHQKDLPARRLAQELNPDFYQEREDEIVRKAKMALRLELMDLYGPRDEEDLMLLYGLQTGLVRLGENYNVIGGNPQNKPGWGVRGTPNQNALTNMLRNTTRVFMPRRELLNDDATHLNARVGSRYYDARGTPAGQTFDDFFPIANGQRRGATADQFSDYFL